MVNQVYSLLKWLSGLAWLGVAGSFLFYNLFVEAEGLTQSPCASGSAQIVWRSTQFCATHSQAHWWTVNDNLLTSILPLAAVVLTVTVGISAQLRRKSSRQ